MDKGFKSPLNILMVTNWFHPDKFGGSERIIYELSKRLVNRGHKVTVITQRLKGLSGEEIIDGIKIVRYPVNHKTPFSFYLSTFLNAKKQFLKLSSQTDFNIIHFHQIASAFSLLSHEGCKKFSKIFSFYAPYYLEFSDKVGFKGRNSLANKLFSLIFKSIEKYNLKRVDAIIVLSNFTKKQIDEIDSSLNKKTFIIPPGVDLERFYPVSDKSCMKRSLNLPDNKIVLFTVRRLVERMGIENLIKAMTSVRKEIKNVLLIIGGDGPLLLKFRTMVDELNLESYVRLVGPIEEEKLPLYYQASDLFVLPTRSLEGFGMVTIEALASGLPVLGTPVGGTVEILGGLDSRLLFTDSSPESIAEKIIEFYTNRKEFELIGEKGRKYAEENYNWNKNIEVIESQYYSLLS